MQGNMSPNRNLVTGFLILVLAPLSIGWNPNGLKSLRGCGSGSVAASRHADDVAAAVARARQLHAAADFHPRFEPDLYPGHPRFEPDPYPGYGSRAAARPSYSAPSFSDWPNPYATEQRAAGMAFDGPAAAPAMAYRVPPELTYTWVLDPKPSEQIEKLARIETHAAIERPVSALRLLALIPDSPSGFRQVFQRNITSKDVKLLQKIRGRSLDVTREVWVGSDLYGKEQLRAQLESFDDSETVVIMAHSTRDGRTVRLPNGLEIEAVEIHEICQSVGKQCVIVTCNGQDLGIRGSVLITEAYGMWRAAQKTVRAKQATTMGELSRTMQKTRRQSRHHTLMAIVGVAGTQGVVYAIHARRRCSAAEGGGYEPCNRRRPAPRPRFDEDAFRRLTEQSRRSMEPAWRQYDLRLSLPPTPRPSPISPEIPTLSLPEVSPPPIVIPSSRPGE